MNVTKEQIDALRPYMENIDQLILSDDLLEFELLLDHTIVELGFDKNDEITEIGLFLQKIYDQIYAQNN